MDHEGLEYAKERAQQYAQTAKTALDGFVACEEREVLELVADFVVDRDR